jgi:hypothetical protein
VEPEPEPGAAVLIAAALDGVIVPARARLRSGPAWGCADVSPEGRSREMVRELRVAERADMSQGVPGWDGHVSRGPWGGAGVSQRPEPGGVSREV